MSGKKPWEEEWIAPSDRAEDGEYVVEDDDGFCVAEAYSSLDSIDRPDAKDAHALARIALISAAPDIARALRDIIKAMGVVTTREEATARDSGIAALQKAGVL